MVPETSKDRNEKPGLPRSSNAAKGSENDANLEFVTGNSDSTQQLEKKQQRMVLQ